MRRDEMIAFGFDELEKRSVRSSNTELFFVSVVVLPFNSFELRIQYCREFSNEVRPITSRL